MRCGLHASQELSQVNDFALAMIPGTTPLEEVCLPAFRLQLPQKGSKKEMLYV